MTFLSERYIMLGVLHVEPEYMQPRLVAVDFIAGPAERRRLEAAVRATPRTAGRIDKYEITGWS